MALENELTLEDFTLTQADVTHEAQQIINDMNEADRKLGREYAIAKQRNKGAAEAKLRALNDRVARINKLRASKDLAPVRLMTQ